MYKVLFVDDNQRRFDEFEEYVYSIFDKSQFLIHGAASIKSAKNLLVTNSYDLLVLDIVLPNSEGEAKLLDGGLILLEYIYCNHELIKPREIIGITSNLGSEQEYELAFKKRCRHLISIDVGSIDWLNEISEHFRYVSQSNIDAAHQDIKSEIIALHGINSFGEWQEDLGAHVKRNIKNTEFNPYKYLLIDSLSFLIPFVRKYAIQRFADEIAKTKQRLLGKDVYFVAHSFGTFILLYALQNYKESFEGLKIKRLVLAGCPVPFTFDIGDLIAYYGFDVINDCATRDVVLCLGQAFVPGIGMVGRSGFTGMKNSRLVNRYKKGGHSVYFEEGDSLNSYG